MELLRLIKIVKTLSIKTHSVSLHRKRLMKEILKKIYRMGKQASRQLKVYGLSRSASNKEVPELRLAGVWMEQLGFTIGDRVNITTRDRLLIIEPVEAEESQSQPNYKAALQEVKQALKKIS